MEYYAFMLATAITVASFVYRALTRPCFSYSGAKEGVGSLGKIA